MKKSRAGAYSWLIFVLLLLYLPILVLAFYSFTDAAMIGQMSGFSLQNYITLFTEERLREIVGGTFLLALVVSVLSTVIGTLGAIGSFYSKKKLRFFYELSNQVPVVNADVVTGFSICILLIVFFGMDKDTYIPLVIGQMVLCTPFVYLSVMPRLKQMDPRVYEAALDLGATPAEALRMVVFREIKPGVISGFSTAIMLSLDDYFIATYTKPAVFDTISTYVVNATKGAQTQIKTALWALSTVIFVLIALIVIFRNTHHKNVMISLALLLVLGLSGCGDTEEEGLTLRIANCEEYIDEGGWEEDEVIELAGGETIFGENSLVEDFEVWYEKTYGEPIEVLYSTYGTNEDLYNQMSLGDVFDLVCPSEYMILKLMEEKRLVPYSDAFFDTGIEENYYAKNVSPYIADIFDELKMNGESVSKYGAGYMWGTLGVVYNPEMIADDEAAHFRVLCDPKYYKQVTMKDSIRDSYFAGLAILNEDKISDPEFITSPGYHEELAEIMNDTSPETVEAVEEILSDMRENAYSLETDSGKADLVT
ncbi:MAG: ABC transporter permease subunit, partial [Lachnospiraceae bacterium]|nr:ABC transporter permease subunit [Lachnospiraceae bacterium]